MTRPCDSQQKENQPNTGLGHSVDHRLKLKESKKKDTYLDLAREVIKNYET